MKNISSEIMVVLINLELVQDYERMNECKVVESFQLLILIQLFYLYAGQTSRTASHQTESQSPDSLQDM
jgi:hypothetical protein